MNKMSKRFISILLAGVIALPSPVLADVLGTHITQIKTEISQGTTLYENAFYNSSVGKQTEHYVEYTPNENVSVTLTNGWSAYGKRTLSKANQILNQLGYSTAMGMNADFFSLQTGIPMSNTIIDGRVYTKDSSWLWGIGFRADDTAFCAKFPIATTASFDDGTYFTIECINKLRQPYALYLYTEDFGSETHSTDKGIDVVLSDVSGDIKLGTSITATIESVTEYDGSVAIPEGKMILSVSSSASDDIKNRIANLTVGQKMTITTNAAESAKLWNTAKYALGLTGGKLITNGQLDFEDDSAAPRSAVGIKKDGTLIFYTIDGRQSGYSYGVRKETLAKRLLELGCVEAVNLDGGGSTTMGATLPGTTSMAIVNSPSDKTERSCANFLFLLKMIEPTGTPYKLILDNYGKKLLSGSTIKISASAIDSSYGPAATPEAIEYYIDKDATPDGSGNSSKIDSYGNLTARGNGEIRVGAKSGNLTGETVIASITTPDTIKIKNAEHGYEVNELILEPNSTVPLTAESYWYGEKLISDGTCYRFTVVSDGKTVGNIESGVFKASNISGATGTLSVSAGTCVTQIPIIIREGGVDGVDEDYPSIDGLAADGTLNAIILYPDLKADDITVTIDNKKSEFIYNEKTHRIKVEYNDSSYHRIGVFVTKNGKSAMKFFDTKEITDIGNKFPDTNGHWAQSYITYLANCGVVNGRLENDGSTNFYPSANMTRCEFAIMLCNYLGIDAESYKDIDLPFTDNEAIPWWAENNIKAIYSLKIMQGQLNDNGVAFNPSANINRMEFAISLSRILPDGLFAAPVTAKDADTIPFWAQESMRTICTQGIMGGYPDGTLLPLNSVTRAEAVKMLYNIFGA